MSIHRSTYQLLALAFCLCLTVSCGSKPTPAPEGLAIEKGRVEAFSEVVQAGVKPLAISIPLATPQMDELWTALNPTVSGWKVLYHREPELMVCDLFPEHLTAGKEVILICKDSLVLEAYQQLKADKGQLLAEGNYTGAAREAIARRMGRLLGYSPKGINDLLAQTTSFRTLADFGITDSNVFLYYKDLPAATRFYEQTLGFELVGTYPNANMFRIAQHSYLVLVDAALGMHSAEEPKSVALAFLTEQLPGWWQYLQEQGVPIKYTYKPKEGGPHDGFVAIDPEGYLLEFETFKQHPENEKFIPALRRNSTLLPKGKNNTVPEGLGFHSAITWLYYKDLLAMQGFYENTLGLELVADQGWTKIYQASPTGFIGLVDERRGMNNATEQKAVNVSFVLEDLEGWHRHLQTHPLFPLRSNELEEGPDGRYKAFVGYDPEGYFMEFDWFNWE